MRFFVTGHKGVQSWCEHVPATAEELAAHFITMANLGWTVDNVERVEDDYESKRVTSQNPS